MTEGEDESLHAFSVDFNRGMNLLSFAPSAWEYILFCGD